MVPLRSGTLYIYDAVIRFIPKGILRTSHEPPVHLTNMASGLESLGAASASLSIFKAIVSISAVVDEAFSFSKECRLLSVNCKVIKLILEKHEDRFGDDPAIKELNKALDKCEKYLMECKEKRVIRNPVFEVTFHRRINKYKEACDKWIMITLLSLQVTRYCLEIIDRAGCKHIYVPSGCDD